MTLVITLVLATQAQAAPDWKTALQGEQRSAAHKQRDEYRHPRQTLEFLGLREDMTVVEISPGGGWYTEILAPLLKDKGTLYAAHYALNPPHPYYRNSLGKFLQKLAGEGKLYGSVVVTQLQPPLAVEAAPAGSADMVLTFRNVHNWVKAGTAGAVLEAAYVSLKPGGVLGIIEHRARPGTSLAAMKESGYVTEALTIELAEAAGFKLSGRSELNANPNDSTDHPKGVWTLPPSLRLGEEKRDHYLGIGESDRMTLKFVKPR
ncbi:MAG: methyltransferase [Gammaproteobacteria bacterium]|nr:methyltransferase [Gammaproteobacteria bacterium]